MKWPNLLRCKETSGYGFRQERCAKLRGHGKWFGNVWHRFVPLHREGR